MVTQTHLHGRTLYGIHLPHTGGEGNFATVSPSTCSPPVSLGLLRPALRSRPVTPPELARTGSIRFLAGGRLSGSLRMRRHLMIPAPAYAHAFFSCLLHPSGETAFCLTPVLPARSEEGATASTSEPSPTFISNLSSWQRALKKKMGQGIFFFSFPQTKMKANSSFRGIRYFIETSYSFKELPTTSSSPKES